MGRKLTALEEIQTSPTDPDAVRQQGCTRLQQQFLERIADTLGITTAQLGEPPDASSAVQSAIDPARQYELVLTQQCADLVKAFVQIQDPQERLRCLQFVREASLTK